MEFTLQDDILILMKIDLVNNLVMLYFFIALVGDYMIDSGPSVIQYVMVSNLENQFV